MRNPILVIALVLASSAIAVAQPVPQPRDYPYRDPYPTQREPYRDRDRDRDHDRDRDRDRYDRYDNSRWQRGYRSRWVTLAAGFSAETRRQFIPVRGRYFDRLRIESVRGSPVIRQVAVIYTNGATQVVKMNTRLPYGSHEVIRLNRAPVQRIVVYTDPRYRGAYTISGGYGRGSRYGS